MSGPHPTGYQQRPWIIAVYGRPSYCPRPKRWVQLEFARGRSLGLRRVSLRPLRGRRLRRWTRSLADGFKLIE